MAETDLVELDGRSSGDRTVMHVLYGLHTVAWFSAGMLAVIAVVLNYVKRSDEEDPLYVMHHNYMISTFWWTLLWLVITAPLWLVFFFPGAFARISFCRSSGKVSSGTYSLRLDREQTGQTCSPAAISATVGVLGNERVSTGVIRELSFP